MYQERKLQPKKGLTAIWPTDFTHTHRGVVSPTQTKIIATGWFTFLDVKAAHGFYTSHYQKIIKELEERQNGWHSFCNSLTILKWLNKDIK